MRIVVIDTGYESFQAEREILARIGARLDIFEGGRHDRPGKLAFSQDADGILLRWTQIDDAFLDAVPGVKALVRYGIGYDNIDLAAATRHGVRVANVQGYANHSVSDHALALILACVRGLLPSRDLYRFRKHFGAPPRPDIPELKDMTLGIVGLGRIGGTLCGKAKGLFRQVLACDPYILHQRFEALGAVPCDLDRLLAESDVVSVHCNLTDETRLMFDASAFAKMRAGAFLVNTARGPVVDEEALKDAVESGRIAATGVDTFGDEPPLENRDPLLTNDRVVATGHYAWYSVPASKELQRRAAENMARFLSGEIPEDCLNPPTQVGEN
jgi:D-3-phosphoglycerate dehydrogenase